MCVQTLRLAHEPKEEWKKQLCHKLVLIDDACFSVNVSCLLPFHLTSSLLVSTRIYCKSWIVRNKKKFSSFSFNFGFWAGKIRKICSCFCYIDREDSRSTFTIEIEKIYRFNDIMGMSMGISSVYCKFDYFIPNDSILCLWTITKFWNFFIN